ncbi:MAG: hypothetical protein V4629_02095 [Pseudomonadota bacterium]
MQTYLGLNPVLSRQSIDSVIATVEANNNLSSTSTPTPQTASFNNLRSSRYSSFFWGALITLSDTAIAAAGVMKRLLPAAAAASAALAAVTKNTVLRFDTETTLQYSLFTGQVNENGSPCIASGTRSFPMEDIHGLNIANTHFLSSAMLLSVILYSLHDKISFQIELAKIKNNIFHAL